MPTPEKDALQKRWRVAVLNSHPIQYFAPLYAYLNSRPDLEVTALYCSNSSLRGTADIGFKRAVTWDIDLLRGYPSRFLGRRFSTRTPRGFFSLICPELWRELRNNRYDAVIIHGHQYAAYLVALVAAKWHGTKVLMHCETHLGLRRKPLKRALRRIALRAIYGLCNGYLAIGTANREFYISLGFDEAKIFSMPYAVDNERFFKGAKLTQEEKTKVLGQLGAPVDKPVVLFASKFQHRKHPEDLLEAVEMLQQHGFHFTTLLIGSGELLGSLKNTVANTQLQHVVFGGFVNQETLPKIYGASDIFVLPSEDEPWGLVVNEAMSSGLPIIVTSAAGCAKDLVRNGENGFVFEARDTDALAAAIKRLVSDPALRERMSRRGLEIIGKWGFEECRVGLLRALQELA